MKKVISTVAIFCLFLSNSLNAQNSISVNDVIYGMMGPAYRDGSEGTDTYFVSFYQILSIYLYISNLQPIIQYLKCV